jgi:hypothetical protein
MLYTVGDGCTYSCDVVKPIVYESIEKAKIDFGTKILEVEEAQAEYQKKYEQWNNRLQSTSKSEKRMELFKERPESPSDEFSFGGQRFSASSFYYSEYDSKKERSEQFYSEPDFISLDEWYKRVD